MRIRSFIRFAAVLLLAALVAVPTFAARGSADFTRVVALGDSLMAGYEAGSLNNAHQDFSPAAIFARQVGTTDFQQPLISYPGVVPELQLVDVSKVPPTILPAPGQGAPLNLGLQRPYNNLAIPGAQLGDLMKFTGPDVPVTSNPYFSLILRGLGTAAQQAVALKPTFILMDIGNNDFLGAATHGTPALLTPKDTFSQQYNALLDFLVAGAPNAGMVVSNLPANFLGIPFFTAVPPVVLNPATNTPLLVNGAPIYYITQSGGKTVQLGPGSYVLLTAASTGLLQQGYGIPAALKPVVPLPHVGEPLPDAVTLTADEAAAITQAVKDYNTIITTAAAQRNIPVADFSALFDRMEAGLHIGPFAFNTSFIEGGLIGLDGIHPTEIGYTLGANEFIKTTNAAYGTDIPLASIYPLFQNNDNVFKIQGGQPWTSTMGFALSPEAAKQIIDTFGPHSAKLHAAHH